MENTMPFNSMDEVVFYSVLSFMSLQFIWQFYVYLRQHTVYLKNTKVPPELVGIMTQETFDKARLYALDKSKYNMFSVAFNFAINFVVLEFNCLVKTWNFGKNTLTCVLSKDYGELPQSAMFILLVNIATSLLHLPGNLYYTFCLEQRHGFNKQTLGFYLRDKFKGHLFTQAVTIPLMCGVIYIIRIGGDFFFIYLWAFVMFFALFLYTIYPDYVAPWFDKYSLLPDGNLKDRIEKLCMSVNFPLKKIYVVENSKRSAHSNAYFYGLFNNKRVVIFDTLIKGYIPEGCNSDAELKKIELGKDEKQKVKEKMGCDTEEVLSILGHELGHWKLNHILKNILIMQINLLILFMAFAFLFKFKSLYTAFGFKNSRPVVVGLILIVNFVCLPYLEIFTIIMAGLSRRFEFQADHYAKTLGRGKHLKLALIKLNSDNLGFPVYDPLYSKVHHSHPPLLERLQALDKSE